MPAVIEDEGTRRGLGPANYSFALERGRREKGEGRRKEGRRGEFRDRDTGCRACRRVDPEINGALITLIEALRRIDTAPIGPVSFRDTDRSYDK